MKRASFTRINDDESVEVEHPELSRDGNGIAIDIIGLII